MYSIGTVESFNTLPYKLLIIEKYPINLLLLGREIGGEIDLFETMRIILTIIDIVQFN